MRIDLESAPSFAAAAGVQPYVSEEALTAAFSAHGLVREVRLVMDKFSGAPRGFAFVEFSTVQEAVRAHAACAGLVFEGQSVPLRISFARDRGAPGSGAAVAGDGQAGPESRCLYYNK